MTKEEALKWLIDDFKPLTRKAAEAKQVIVTEMCKSRDYSSDLVEENKILKKRCFFLCHGKLCCFCNMKCEMGKGE